MLDFVKARWMSQIVSGLIVSLSLTACAPLLAGGITAGSAAYIYVTKHNDSPTAKADEHIKQQVQQAIAPVQNKSYNHIRVVVFNKHVVLVGHVKHQLARQRLTDIVQKNKKINSLYNVINIGPANSYSRELNNKWVKIKINTALLNLKDLDHTPFAIINDNGIIYILGDQLSKGQLRVIRNHIHTIKGVNTIIYLTHKQQQTIADKSSNT